MSVLLRKEFLELVRTRRFLALPLVFVFFGISGPAVIRLLPLLLEGAATEGMQIVLPETGPGDGFLQYLELARQLGLLAAIVVFMNIIAGERKDGILAVLFVKPVRRFSYLAVRFGVNGAYVIVSMLLGALVAVLYAGLLLGPPEVGAMMAAACLYAAYSLLVFSWTFFFSALVRSPAAAAGLSVIPLFVFPFLGTFWAPLGTYGPYGVLAAGGALIGTPTSPAAALGVEAFASLGLNLGLSLLLLVATYAALRKAEL
jgi:ABC-2 type transport system permease protein